MTRINIVEPSELSDQHLVAEYREIFHVGSALQRTLASPNRDKLLEDRPTEFTLNKGHTKFFFDKGKYCLLYTSPSPRDQRGSRMPSSA